eukprot:747042-Hanusia_phi.AAC.2
MLMWYPPYRSHRGGPVKAVKPWSDPAPPWPPRWSRGRTGSRSRRLLVPSSCQNAIVVLGNGDRSPPVASSSFSPSQYEVRTQILRIHHVN